MAALINPDFLTPPADPTAPPDPAGNDWHDFGTTGGFLDATNPTAAATPPDMNPDGTRRTPLDLSGSGLPGSDTQQQMLADATAQNASLASGAAYGGTDLSNGAPVSGSLDPNASRMSRNLGDPTLQYTRNLGDGTTTPGTPTTPGADTPAANVGAGLPGSGGQLTDQQWQDQFTKQFGYYDPVYDSRANFLREAQLGDTAIRGMGATPGADQLAGMAKYDSDAALLSKQLGTGGAGAGIYGSQLGADWVTQHNDPLLRAIDSITAAGGKLNPQASAQLEGLRRQVANVPATPVPNTQAFPVFQELQTTLAKLGATDIHAVGTDIYYTPASGTGTGVINGGAHISLVNWVDKLAQLKDALAAQSAPAPAAPTGGGGGSPPRYSAPRGGGGFAPPPQAPTPPSFTGFSTNPDVSNQNPIGSSANTDALAQQRATQLATLANANGGAKGLPGSVASAVSYAPGIYPGGYSPYDQP